MKANGYLTVVEGGKTAPGRVTVQQIAQVCHEANRAYCRTIGDLSQPAWENAPAWQKRSSIDGVKFVLANPDHPIDALHTAWLEAKVADGWKCGPKKDAEKKEHPCMVPFDVLPLEQQIKDFLFQAVVAAFV